MITPSSRVPLYRAIADDLRNKIQSGEYDRHGLPSERDLQATYGVSKYTILAALRVLVEEGLVSKQAGARTRVRETPVMARVRVDLTGREVGARGATETEAEHYAIPIGFPMLILVEVTPNPDGTLEELELDAWPADRTRLQAG